MKLPRSLMVWATLALCGALVLGAMLWLTRGVMASEKERTIAEARADLEERTRLALWRMDAVGAAIMLGENQRLPSEYDPAGGLMPSKELFVKMHFELRQFGKLTSPDSASREKDFENLRGLLKKTPLPGDEWSALTCAADASETAWQAIPKEAAQLKLGNSIIRQQLGSPQVRNEPQYQTNASGTERAQRAKSVEETVSKKVMSIDPQAASDRITDVGNLRATWVGGELLLLRQLNAIIPGALEKRVQGVWLDQEVLKNKLLAEVRDLLPNASLTTVARDAGNDPLALVSFPLHLQRNEKPPAVAAYSVSGPLAAGWGAVLLAILTTSLLVHGVMRLSERRASFVSAVTHELRTPLTTFRLYSDMLETGAVKPEKRGDYLRVLSREADRLSHLVENVLAFSQIERGSARSVVRESTVRNLLDPMRERFEARLATAGLTLEMDLETAAAANRVKVDAAALEHILFNLIDNAAKYAAASQPPVVVVLIETVGRHITISVNDHGPGIAPGEQKRIFRAFHKSAREAAESRPGVGLGLALSRRLAKSLGGKLECVSGKGASFVLTLPLVA
jgi:signal transduction histidine kinase